jgi:hypothetical protein
MFSKEELVERLNLLEKIEIGIKQSDNEEIITEEELEAEIKKWFE